LSFALSFVIPYPAVVNPFDATETLGNWLDAAAKKQPVPGGGSVTALVAALAAAMGEMTLNYSVGRMANSPEQNKLLSDHLAELARARLLLLSLMEEDQRAYTELTTVRKLDPADPGQREQLKAATAAAIAVPQAIMAAGLRILDHAHSVAGGANEWLLSDLAVCCELALAAVRCGGYNVRANLSDVSAAESGRLRRETAEQINLGVERLQATLAVIDSRTGGGGA
jgi:glutamate formiminotransferase/formiminotetrahydrofolate cyclodeaminase